MRTRSLTNKDRDESRWNCSIYVPRPSRSTRSRQRAGTRKYRGEDGAKVLVDFLNSGDPHGTPKRPLELLELLQEYIGLASYSDRGPTPAEQSRLNELHGRVNKILRQWVGSQALVRTSSTGARVRFDMYTRIETARNDLRPIFEWSAIQECLELATEGAIHRVKKCGQCQRWFFARFARGDRSQRLCPSCAKRWRKSPEYRKQMAAYMRAYRERWGS